MTNNEHEDFQQKVADMRRLLGIEGNVLSYRQSHRLSNDPPVIADVRCTSTFDPTGTVETSVEHDPLGIRDSE